MSFLRPLTMTSVKIFLATGFMKLLGLAKMGTTYFPTIRLLAECTLLLSLVVVTFAVKGHQRPNTLVSVPEPQLSPGNDVVRDNRGQDRSPPGCYCNYIARVKNNTPDECVDYCVWRWGWY